MQLVKLLIVFVLLLLMVPLLWSLQFGTQASNPARHLGFWVSETDVSTGGSITISAQKFYKSYFGTPPYPSFLWFVISFDNSSVWAGSYLHEISYFRTLMGLAAANPTIHVGIQIIVDMASRVNSAQLKDFLKNMTAYSSQIVGIQPEEEFFDWSSTYVIDFQNDVTGAGLPYWSPGVQQPWTSFPWNGAPEDQFWSLCCNSKITGIAAGFATKVNLPFPYTSVKWPTPTTRVYWGSFNKQIIDHEVTDFSWAPAGYKAPPAANRQYDVLIVGMLPYSQPAIAMETGGKGWILWDSVELRNWIWNNPNYTSNFLSSYIP